MLKSMHYYDNKHEEVEHCDENRKEDGQRSEHHQSSTVRAKYYTPEISKVKIHSKMPLKIQWRNPVKIHRESDNPLENTTDK